MVQHKYVWRGINPMKRITELPRVSDNLSAKQYEPISVNMFI